MKIILGELLSILLINLIFSVLILGFSIFRWLNSPKSTKNVLIRCEFSEQEYARCEHGLKAAYLITIDSDFFVGRTFYHFILLSLILVS